MVSEVAQIMHSRFDPVNFSIKIPVIFDQLKGEDASFEMVVSNDIQPLRLFYSDNIITHSRAVIFVNTGINRLADIDEEQFKEDMAIRMHKESPQYSINALKKTVVGMDAELKQSMKEDLYTLEIPDALQ